MHKHRKRTDGERAVEWIQLYCVQPDGTNAGKKVRLTPPERATLYAIYDAPSGPRDDIELTGALAAYVALLHLVGVKARSPFHPSAKTDSWTLWRAAGPDLRQHLQRVGDAVICKELGTRWPSAA